MSQAIRVCVSLAIILGTQSMLQLRSSGQAVAIRKPLDALPSTVGEWRELRGTILGADILDKLSLTDYVMRDYADASGREVNLYIGYWDEQDRSTSVHSPKNCLPGTGWEPVDASVATIALPEPHSPINVNRYLVQKDREQQVVLYWYQLQGRAIAGEVAARMALVKGAILRGQTNEALVRVMSPVHGSVRETSDRLAAYVGALYPVLADHLP